MKVLVIYSEDSSPTRITARAARECIRIFKHAGHDAKLVKVYALAKNYAIGLIFRSLFKIHKHDIICYFGHGSPDKLWGQLPIALLSPILTLKWADLVEGKIVYTVACLSARELGPATRARAYFGSTYYMFVGYPYKGYPYDRDFIDTFLVIPKALASGRDDYEDMLSEYKDRCMEYALKYEDKRIPGWQDYSYAMRINATYYTLIRGL